MKNNFILLIFFICSISLVIKPTFVNANITYSNIKEITPLIEEDDYIDLIRSSLFEQPEFKYATALSSEQEFNLKYAKRGRFPSISGNIINDESIERNITDNQSVRKRRDDSFDATVEIKQPIYTGGQINAAIRGAKNRAKNSATQKFKTVSSLILDANSIYLNAANSQFLFDYANNLLNELKPIKEKVNDRVNAGIMDPVESALFSVRYNNLETLVFQLKSASEKNNNNFSFFFKREPLNLAFPKYKIDEELINISKNSYDVDSAQFEYLEKKENIISVRSEYLPQMGVRAQYTKYDIDDDSNEDDIRGGLYLSVPLFNFGRGLAKINSAKAAAEGSKNAINVAEKDDSITESSLMSDFNNSIDNRIIFLNAFKTTIKQRKTIQDRLESSGFAANALTEVIINEISQLKTLLDNESYILQGYLSLLHQNQQLNSNFRIRL